MIYSWNSWWIVLRAWNQIANSKQFWEDLIFYGSLLFYGFGTFVDILFGFDFDFEGFLAEFKCIQRLLVIGLIWIDHANDWAFGVFAETFLKDPGKFWLPVDDKCITFFLAKYRNDFWEC